jgi:hypothetical protein
MSAILVMPTAKEWKVIKPFLDKCQEGAIVIAPEIQATLTQEVLEKTGERIDDGDFFEYEFGGQPDICIDVVSSLDHLAADLLRGEDDND